ncbi:MAG: cupin domain-containing protein [Ectobacillus sp.]
MKQYNINEFMEYSEAKFTKRIIFKEGGSVVFMLNFKPGQELPAHKHPGTNVHLLVLEGEGTFKINGTGVKAKQRDTILCTGEEELAFVNDGDRNTSLYVVLNSIPDERYAQSI